MDLWFLSSASLCLKFWLTMNHSQVGAHVNLNLLSFVNCYQEVGSFTAAQTHAVDFTTSGTNICISQKINSIFSLQGISSFL